MNNNELHAYMAMQEKKINFCREWDDFFWAGFWVFTAISAIALIIQNDWLFGIGFGGFFVTGGLSIVFGHIGLFIMRRYLKALDKEVDKRKGN